MSATVVMVVLMVTHLLCSPTTADLTSTNKQVGIDVASAVSTTARAAATPTPPLTPRASFLQNRLLYYSPSSIGDDVITSEIDFYTLPFMPLHKVYLPEIVSRFNVTGIIVNNRWSACDDCHSGFLSLLSNFYPKLRFYITLIAPTDGLTAKKVNALLKEETRELSKYGDIFKGFYVPQPERMISDNEWSYYFNFVNILPTLFGSVPFTMIVEFPMYKTTFKMMTNIDLTTVFVESWVMTSYIDVPGYFDNMMSVAMTCFKSRTKYPKMIGMMVSSSYDNVNRTENQLLQVKRVKSYSNSLEFYNNKYYNIFTGSGYYEFSDEWWASSSSDSGFDIEGCPNFNPYAHTKCGFRVDSSSIINSEWLGLFSLVYYPFQTCLKSKLVADELGRQWKSQNTSTYSSTICAPYMPPIIMYIDFPFSAIVLTGPFIFLAFALCCVIGCSLKTKPKPKKDLKEYPLLSVT